jgi:lipopolysaccharide biosynthesis regulator YciM
MIFIRLLVLVVLLVVIAVLGALQLANPGVVNVSIPLAGSYSVPVMILLILPLTLLLTFLILIIVDVSLFLRRVIAHGYRTRSFRGHELLQQAEELLANGYTALALEVSKQAVRAVPKNHRGHVLLGNILRRQGKLNEAIDAYEDGLQVASEKGPLLLAQIRDLGQNQEPAVARRLLKRALAEHSNNLSYLAEMRRILSAEGRFEEAIKVQWRILQLVPSKEAAQRDVLRGLRLQVARRKITRGRFWRAWWTIRRVLHAHPKFVDGHRARVDLLLARGRTKAAFRHLHGAYETTRAPALLEKLFDLRSHLTLELFEKLLRDFENAFQDDAVFHLMAGRFYREQEAPEQAAEYFARVAALGLPVPEVYEFLATREEKAEQPDHPRVIALLRQALTAQKSFEEYYHCSACGHRLESWVPECPECGAWNTVQSNLPGLAAAALVADQSAA